MLYLNIFSLYTNSNGFFKFNFNKCCIWILLLQWKRFCRWRFNFNKCCIWIIQVYSILLLFCNLTLTSVVFESSIFFYFIFYFGDLTLTSVVFESTKFLFQKNTSQFNFNKCCIWIKYIAICRKNSNQFNFNKCCIWIHHQYYIFLLIVFI